MDNIGIEQIRKANEVLQKYKTGKKNLENKIIENEQFWKKRQWESTANRRNTPSTSWLWNMIVSKHADMEDSYPSPSFLARAKDDEEEAKRLTSIVPVILEQNKFAEVYSDCAWYKLKQGACCYGIFWDGQKLNGLGDVSICKIDLINLFWEPGITDIQKSKNIFHLELMDNELLEQIYPETKGKLTNSAYNVKQYIYDDSVDNSDKSCVVDWYYKKYTDKGWQVHLCKFVDEILLFSSENEAEKYPNGWYAHGKYPFVIDCLYDIEGSIVGYGYTDICKDDQIQIDVMSDALVKNTVLASKKRFIIRSDGSINEREYADLTNDFVHCEGNTGEDSIRELSVNAISGNSIAMYQQKIAEMKDTTGNNDVSTGTTPSGVTAASAIAALQETAGKTSRDLIKNTYKAYKEIIYIVVDLIREYYDFDRQFRIIGDDGQNHYVNYSNSMLKPQEQPSEFGIENSYRTPIFDIVVSPEKASAYSKMEQNELALNFYKMGFYSPQNTSQALACLEAMDFDTKEKTVEIISRNGTLFDKLQLYAQLAYTYAAKYDPNTAMQLEQDIATLGITVGTGDMTDISFSENNNDARVERARKAAANVSQPR